MPEPSCKGAGRAEKVGHHAEVSQLRQPHHAARPGDHEVSVHYVHNEPLMRTEEELGQPYYAARPGYHKVSVHMQYTQ